MSTDKHQHNSEHHHENSHCGGAKKGGHGRSRNNENQKQNKGHGHCHHHDSSGGKGKHNGGSFGKGGFCICAKCGEKIPHQKGIKCTTLKCLACGKTMVREELLLSKQ